MANVRFLANFRFLTLHCLLILAIFIVLEHGLFGRQYYPPMSANIEIFLHSILIPMQANPDSENVFVLTYPTPLTASAIYQNKTWQFSSNVLENTKSQNKGGQFLQIFF